MFGSILAMSPTDVYFSAALSVVVLGLFVFCYHKLFAVAFDESFARATGVGVERYNVLIAILTAVTIVLGMRMMGAMLISSLIIFPAITSMRVFKSFRGVVVSWSALPLGWRHPTGFLLLREPAWWWQICCVFCCLRRGRLWGGCEDEGAYVG